MAQFYTLEEAARVLGMSPEELKGKAQHREIRAFMDSGSWRFRVADIDELARRRGLGSDPDLSLSDPDLSLSKLDLTSHAGDDEVDLSEFQLGAAKPNLGQPTGDIPAFGGPESDKDVLLDDLSVPPGGPGNSSSTILGMKASGKLPSDSDVRLVPDSVKSASDSDVRLTPHKPPSDSDVTLVNDQSVQDFPTLHNPGDTTVRQSPMLGSSAEVPTGHTGSDSDFELSPSSVIDALQPESGSDFELSAIDASDEFDSTPLSGPGDSDVTAAAPADSGINLGRPSDSGINLGGIEGINLGGSASSASGSASVSGDSIGLAPLDDGGPQKPAPKPKAAEPAKPKASLSATPPPVARKGEKDIFEDTDFEVDALDSGEDRTMQLEAASDFDIDESDSASEVFAIDEEDVDENASTAMAPAMLDEESGEFGAEDEEIGGGIASSGWDVDSEATPVAAGSQGTMIPTSRDSAEWGGLWIGFLGVATFLTLFAAFVSIDLIRNLYDFRGGTPASGIIKSIAGLLGG
jgi:hypothetical protein